MITEIVFIDLPPGTTRAEALSIYRTTAKQWVSNHELIEKYYFFDEETHMGGGVYVWPNREAAQRGHGDDYVAMVEAKYGSRPRFQILDALIHIDPAGGKITEL